MKFTAAAVIAFAAGAMANSNVTVVTEVVESFVTYCPAPTTFTHGSSTYTVTEPTTLTITDCPCTITHPVTTATATVCHTCPGVNTTVVPPPTGGVTTPPTNPTSPPTAGAGKAGLSAAAGVLGLAAFFL